MVNHGIMSVGRLSGRILFSPNGGIQYVWLGGDERKDAQRVFLLLGRGENGGVQTGGFITNSSFEWYLRSAMLQRKN